MSAKSDSSFPIYLTTKEVCGMLKCTPRYIQNLIDKKRGPPVHRLPSSGKDAKRMRLRFKKSDLVEWLERNGAR